MDDRRRRKLIFKYVSGILILGVCVLLAWFLPEVYGNWQDRHLIGRVQLSGREELAFLDGNLLDVMERWELLASIDNGTSGLNEYDISWEEGGSVTYLLEQNMEAVYKKCTDTIKSYAGAGLLPFEWKEDYASQMGLEFYYARIVYFGETDVPLGFLRFFIPTEDSGIYCTVLIDLELLLPYYVSAAGWEVQEGMAKELGYESYEHMFKVLKTGEQEPVIAEEDRGIDYSAAFEMDSVQVQPGIDGIDQMAEATLQEIEIPIHRLVVEWDSVGPGVAVISGMLAWMSILLELQRFEFEYAGEIPPVYGHEYGLGTEVWKRNIVNGIF